MGRDAQVHFRVESDRKDRWKTAAKDQNEYRDLTHLIITAVEREIREESVTGNAMDHDVSVDLDPVHSRLDDQRERLEEISGALHEIQAFTRSDEDIMDVARTILDELPEVDSEEEIRHRQVSGSIGPVTLMQTLGREQAIVKYFQREHGWDNVLVLQALEELTEQISTVQCVRIEDQGDELDGMRETEFRYFKLTS